MARHGVEVKNENVMMIERNDGRIIRVYDLSPDWISEAMEAMEERRHRQVTSNA